MRTLTELRQDMDKAIKADIVPVLRAEGFKGGYPNFYRRDGDRLDLLSFGFNRYGGGVSLCVGQCQAGDFTTSWGQIVPMAKMTSAYLASTLRHQFGWQGPDGQTDFCFKDGRIADCVSLIKIRMPEVWLWFSTPRAYRGD